MMARVIEWIAGVSLATSVLQSYFIVNKCWRRKHERAVADAQSITSNLLGLLTQTPWVIKYILDSEIKNAAVNAIGLLQTVFFTLLAIGFWVPTEVKVGFWARVKRALRLERAEAGQLVTALFRPSGAHEILHILDQLALLDRHLDEREARFIGDFARAWGIAWAPPDPNAEHAGDAVRLRASVEHYLALNPAREQVIQLRGVVDALVKIDTTVTEDEAMVSQEVVGMLDAYCQRGGTVATHKVILIPQDEAQHATIRSVLRKTHKLGDALAEPVAYRGGAAYVAGKFYSARFAGVICARYEAMGLFTLVDKKELEITIA